MNFEELRRKTREREYRQTCRPEMRDPSEVETVKKIIAEKGEEWVIIALVDGSIGYHYPSSAKCLVDAILEDTYYGSERTSAIYKNDLLKEIIDDCCKLADLLENYPDDRKVKMLFENIEKLKKMSTIESMTFSTIYPTG